MNKWTGLAILFTLFCFGAIQESWRIFTSSEADIAANRSELIVIASVITGGLIFCTIIFWQKSSKYKA